MATLLVITGLGITQYRIVGPLTFGLLTKNLASRIHSALTLPFLVCFGLHLYHMGWPRLRARFRKGS